MIARPLTDRLAARRRGIHSERLAELVLRLKLFRILARNYRVRGGEIDLIAQRGKLIVFVEVKARGRLIDGMESVDAHKQRRITRAAHRWIATHPEAASCSFRADGLFVVPRRWPCHVPALFELGLD